MSGQVTGVPVGYGAALTVAIVAVVLAAVFLLVAIALNVYIDYYASEQEAEKVNRGLRFWLGDTGVLFIALGFVAILLLLAFMWIVAKNWTRWLNPTQNRLAAMADDVQQLTRALRQTAASADQLIRDAPKIIQDAVGTIAGTVVQAANLGRGGGGGAGGGGGRR